MSDYTISKSYTNNPFVDDLLYYVKKLAFGCVIKNMQTADSLETEESLKNSDMLIMCTEQTAKYNLFEYTLDEMTTVGVDSTIAIGIIKGSIDPSTGYAYNYEDSIPALLKEPLRQLAMKNYLDNYVELNDYYRMICGLPNIGDYGIPIRDYEYLMPENNMWDATYIHEIGTEGSILLDSYGIITQIKADYPKAEYLDYITCGITPYKARKAFEFQMLYSPTIDSDTIQDQFSRTYENNRIYIITTYYSEAFKYNSDYYSNFICILILLLTMTEMLSKVQEYIIRKDLLDQRCVQCLFEQYGVDYYTSIPLKYQQRICKNLNSLIRSKSSAKGMFSIINLFGAEDITVFRYFILRDRNIDAWGNYVYNEIITKTSEYNNVLDHTQTEISDINNITIPLPFTHYLEKGNVMIVWLKMADGSYKRIPGTDYDINNYNNILFHSGVTTGAVGIRYDFYYDNRTISSDPVLDTTNALITKVDVSRVSGLTFSFKLPYTAYISDGNEFIVILAGQPLQKDAYTINYKASTITLNSSFKSSTNFASRDIYILYLYTKKSMTKFIRTDVISTSYKQKSFKIPEPFFDYCLRGNAFFITLGNTFISSERYTINTDNTTITFDDSVIIDADRAVSFNFVYILASVYTDISINTFSEVLDHSGDLQIEFKLHPPFENYLKTGYKIFVKINGNYLEQDWYSTYYNTLSLNSKSIGINDDDKIEAVYIYGPFGDTSVNIACTQKHYSATQNNQTVFTDIEFPEQDFFSHKGKVIVDVYGRYLDSDKYSLDEPTRTLTILDIDNAANIGQVVNIFFVFQDESDNAIKINQQTVIATQDGQVEYNMTLPFYPYFETGHSMVVMYQSQIINPSDITINNTSITVKNNDIKSGHELVMIFFYNNWYLLQTKNKIKVEDVLINPIDKVDNDLQIEIPAPMTDYLENNWPWFLSDSSILIPDTKYDVVNSGLGFLDSRDILKHNTLDFTFIYMDGEEFIHENYDEDVETDFNLRFVGTSLEEENDYFVNKIIKAKTILPYDTTTLDDVFWDGVGSDADTLVSHEEVKKAILKKKFNYERTKYFGLNYVISIADMSFQIAYFYNLLYDDVLMERDLNVSLPNISEAKQFNLGLVFCYLTALAYEYSGIDDTIMDTPSKILYVKGFNMRSDLNVLKEYVLSQRQKIDAYPVWNFIIQNSQVKTMDKFLNIYNTNKSVFQTIVKGMHASTKYRDYKIWKKLYDSLMIWKFNLTYFIMDSTGSIAPTFSAYIEDQDSILYHSLEQIKSISGEDTKKEYIATTISNIVYLLEDYLGGYEFHHVFDGYPGVSEEALMNYAYKIINFFKSYKIVLRSKGNFITFDNSDPNINSLRPIDDIETKVSINKPEYIYLSESKDVNIHTRYKDSIDIKEHLQITVDNGTNTNTVRITILKYDNQVIHVFALGSDHTESFDVPYDTDYYCTLVALDGFSAGKLNITHDIATSDVTISATEPGEQTVTISIIQSDHQTIVVGAGDPDSDDDNAYQEYTSTFTTKLGTQITVRVDGDYGWTAGSPSYVSGIINANIIITATPATIKSASFSITTIAIHQLFELHVYDKSDPAAYTTYRVDGGQYGIFDYLLNKSVQYGTRYEVTITGRDGYETGELLNDVPLSGIFTGHIDFAVKEMGLRIYNIKITQSEHQLMTLTLDKVNKYTKDCTARYGTNYSAIAVSDDKYSPGAVIVQNTSGYYLSPNGIVIGDMSIYVEPATEAKPCVVTIIQSSHQTITVSSGGTNYTNTFNGKIGDVFTAQIVPDPHYISGVIINSSGVLSHNITVYATPAIPMEYTLAIKQSAHQTITVTANGTKYTSNVILPYGTTYTVEVVADTGYLPGVPSVTIGTVTDNSTVTASDAVQGSYFIYLSQSDNQMLYTSINGGANISDPKTPAIYGDIYKIFAIGDNGYAPGTVTVKDISGAVADNHGSIFKDLYGTVAAASIIYYTLSIQKYTNQKITVTINSKTYTDDIPNLRYGDTWTATIASTDSTYNPGKLILSSGTITDNYTVRATDATVKGFNITINAPADGDIYMTYDLDKSPNNEYTIVSGDTLVIPSMYGAKFKFVGVPSGLDKSLATGTPIVTGSFTEVDGIYTVTGDITVTMNMKVKITINQVANETIKITTTFGTVILTDQTTTFNCYKGSTYTAVLVPDDTYDPGTLSIASTGTFNADTTVTATTAFKLPKLIAYSTSGDMYVTYKGIEYLVKETSSTENATIITNACRDGETFTAFMTPTGASKDKRIDASYCIYENSYLQFIYTNAEKTTVDHIVIHSAGTNVDKITIGGNIAAWFTCTSTNQTVYISYTDLATGELKRIPFKANLANLVVLNSGTAWTAEAVGDDGYLPGVVIPSSGIANGKDGSGLTILTVTDAVKQRTFTATAPSNGDLYVTFRNTEYTILAGNSLLIANDCKTGETVTAYAVPAGENTSKKLKPAYSLLATGDLGSVYTDDTKTELDHLDMHIENTGKANLTAKMLGYFSFPISSNGTPHQTVYVNYNDWVTGEAKRISSNDSGVWAGTNWTAEVIADKWYTAGTLNITSGIVDTRLVPTKLIATPATVTTDYDLTILVAKSPYADVDIYGMNAVGIWNNKPDPIAYDFGSVTPYYVIDALSASNNGNIFFAFWGGDSVNGLFKTFTADFTAPNGINYQICKNIPNSSFNQTGDITIPYSNVVNKQSTSVIRSLNGQKINLHVHIDI